MALLLALQTPTQPENIIVVLTDDQRWDTLWAMPAVERELAQKGVEFKNAYVSDPQCCPFRASFLGGGYYAHRTHVLTNSWPNGGSRRFADRNSLAQKLQTRGFRTAIIGKYLNDYERIAPHVPPGWTLFHAITSQGNFKKFGVVTGSSSPNQATRGRELQVNKYITDYIRDRALEFIDENRDKPFFLLVSTTAPHGPATAADGDESLFSDFRFKRSNLGESNLTDKPTWVQSAAREKDFANFSRNQLRSLQSVDRMVHALINRLTQYGLLTRTRIIFTSDNGLMWGEHGLYHKSKPYQESLRVPLIIRADGLTGPISARIEENLVVVNLDIAQTILNWGRVNIDSDGEDLTPLVRGRPKPDWRWQNDGFLIQYFEAANLKRFKPPLWAGWVTPKYKYVFYPQTGEEELYDLMEDNFELESKHALQSHAEIRARLRKNVEASAGLIITTSTIRHGRVGTMYSDRLLSIWGNGIERKWSVTGPRPLPDGLQLNAATGLISGIPRVAGNFTIQVRVEDTVRSPQDNLPQSYTVRLRLRIAPEK
ncbi:MAG: sulfatase-like hydrolase/transferase [Gammaproteobacteria bacterium]|nr:sulfatase-like hydrolase/transferase [Gammaproteobacteria bacterium]